MWTLSHLCEHILTFEWDHSIVLNSGPGTLHAASKNYRQLGWKKKGNVKVYSPTLPFWTKVLSINPKSS